MSVIWIVLVLQLLSFGAFSDGLTGNVPSRPTVVSIGAFLTFNSTIGRVAKIALREAVKDVNNNSSVLNGTKLVIKMQNSNCSGFPAMVGALQFMETDYVAVIGPQSSMVAHSMSYIANELQVPLLSFSATDPTLSSPQFPYFIRTTQSDLYQMEAIAEIVEYYGWREVITIFLDDDYGRNEVSEFDDALAARRCKISFKAGVPPATGASRSDIMDILVKVALMEPRVIVLHVNPNVGFTVFSVASYLGMMRDGYVWIATDWLSSVLDSSFPLPSDTMDSMQGVLVLRHHTPDSERKRAFLDRWKKLTGGSLGLNAYALYAYDTVWLIAHALNSFLDQGGVISFSNDSKLSSAEWSNPHLEALSIFDGGPHLLSNILQSDFIGLTGPIKFNSERSLILPAYDIINVLGTGFRQIGYWSNHSGLSTLAPDTLYSRAPNRSSANHKLHNVIWPGDPKAKPRGWAFPNNGKVLKIGVPWRISFREFVSLVPGTDAFEGFCIDVFSAAVNLLPYALPYKFVPYGDGHKNPSYTELVSQVTAGMFDGAVGDIGIVSNRTKMVDFTQPYVSSGLVVVAPYKKLNTGAWAFLRPFSRRMWGVTAVSSLIVGIIVWILERRINNEFRGPPKTQLVTILWFGISTLFLGHKENTLSNSLGRMVLLIWLFVVLVINSSYTASLTSILTVQQLYSPIKGIESLKHGDDPIGYQVGSFAENYLIEVIGIAKTRLVPVGSPEEYLELLQRGPKEGGVAAVVDERPYVELFLSSRCKFRTVSLLEFTRNGWGFAFPRDSPLAVDLSTAILRLSENGDLQRIHDRWFNKSSCIFDKADTESDRLHLGSFEGLFLICGIAFFIGLSIFFIQIMLEFRKAARADPISLGHGSSCSRRLRKLLYLIDEKKDQSNRDKKRRKIERSVSDDDADQEIDLGRNLRRQSQISVDNNID